MIRVKSVIKKCIICNKEFKAYHSKIIRGRAKYCSKKCSDSNTLFIKGQRASPNTEIKKGDPLPEHIRTKQIGKKPWNNGLKGVMKPNSGSFKTGVSVSPRTQFRKGTPQHLHPRWRGGKSFEPYPLGWNNTFREQIRYRDGYKCALCGLPEIEHGRKLSVHHIDYDKKNLKENNLISLCLKCHVRTNSNREYWVSVFNGEEKVAI